MTEKAKRTVWYWFPDDEEEQSTSGRRLDVPINREIGSWMTAEAAADDYERNHDGWEDHDWPKRMLIDDAGEIVEWTVEREMVVQFTANRVEKEDERA